MVLQGLTGSDEFEPMGVIIGKSNVMANIILLPTYKLVVYNTPLDPLLLCYDWEGCIQYSSTDSSSYFRALLALIADRSFSASLHADDILQLIGTCREVDCQGLAHTKIEAL